MPIKGGRGVNGKITYIKLDDFDATETLMKIRETDRDLLLILSEQLDWSNRWLEPPPPLDNPDDRDAYIAGLKKRLMEMIDFCAEMINCITTDTDVKDAINNVYNQYNGGVPLPVTETTRGLGVTIIDCNRDNLWGAINQLVDSMHDNNQDLFEVMESSGNIAERAALIYSAIPVAETLPINEAIDWIQSMWTDDLMEAYAANDSEEYRTELKCDLFCAAYLNGCVLTFDMLYAYFSNRVGTVTLDTFIDLAAYMVTGVWVGTQVNDIFYLIQLGAMWFGNRYGAVTGLRSFDTYMALGNNNPDADWLILCEECGIDWFHLLEDTDFPSPATFQSSLGTISGSIISQTTTMAHPAGVTGISINITFATLQHLMGIKITATNLFNIPGSGVVNRFYTFNDISGGIIASGDLPVQTEDWEVFTSHDVPSVKSVVIQYVFLGTTNTMDLEVTLYGLGTDPFI